MHLHQCRKETSRLVAAKGAVSGMVEGRKALVTSPVDTTKNAVKGMGRWLGNVGGSITSHDPHQDNVWKTARGYDAAKRAYAIEMGIDPYTDFEPFQERLGEVAGAALESRGKKKRLLWSRC